MPPVARPPGPLLHEELVRHVLYDPLTGVSTWRLPGPRRQVGGLVGNIRESSGYRECQIFGEFWRHNRLVWFYMTGERPPEDMIVDHRNRLRHDDRWENLRLVTPGQNVVNTDRWGEDRGVQTRVGKRGVRYRVRIRERDNTRHLGTFLTIEEARAAFREAASEQYGEFYAS